MRSKLRSRFSIVHVHPLDRSFYLSKIQSDPFFKGAYVRSLSITQYRNRISKKNRRFIICKEIFQTVPVVLYAKKDFYLLEALGGKLTIFRESGLIEFWHLQHLEKKSKAFKSTHRPKVLDMDHLMGCFQLLYFGFVLSFVVLSLEILISKLSISVI